MKNFFEQLKNLTDNHPDRLKEQKQDADYLQFCKIESEKIKQEILQAAAKGERSFFINFPEKKVLETLAKEGIVFEGEEDEFGPTYWYEYSW